MLQNISLSKFKYLFCALTLVTIASCGYKEQSYRLPKIKSCNFPDNPKEEAPLWVCNVNIEGYVITGVGSVRSSKAGIQFMTNQAATNARVVIAQELKTKVSNEIKNYIESKGLGDSETVINVSSSVASQITDSILVGSKILRTVSSSNGTLYVLAGLTKESYEATLKKAFSEAAKTEQQNLKQNNFSVKSFNTMANSIIDSSN